MAEFDFVSTFDLPSRDLVSLPHQSTQSDFDAADRLPPAELIRGSFTSFVCHLSHLDTKLRSNSSLVLDDSAKIQKTSRVLGKGKTFLVRQASWVKDPDDPPLEVALKEIIPEAVSNGHPTR